MLYQDDVCLCSPRSLRRRALTRGLLSSTSCRFKREEKVLIGIFIVNGTDIVGNVDL